MRLIVDLAPKIGADLMVIGATGHSALYERLIGSRADRIVQMADCPVLVVKRRLGTGRAKGTLS